MPPEDDEAPDRDEPLLDELPLDDLPPPLVDTAEPSPLPPLADPVAPSFPVEPEPPPPPSSSPPKFGGEVDDAHADAASATQVATQSAVAEPDPWK